jgi:cell division septation protein DedD
MVAVVVVVSSLAGLLGFSQQYARAAQGVFKLSPTGGSVQVGGTLSVKVLINTGGDSVNAMAARISYDPTILGNPVVTPTSFFGNSATWPAGNQVANTVYMDLYSFSGVTATSDTEVATVQFKALKAGSTALSFANVSSAGIVRTDAQDIYAFSPTGGTYTVTSVPVAGATTNTTASQPKATTTTPAKSSAKTTAQTPAGSAPPAATDPEPVISDLKVSDVSGNTATVSWKTNVPATSSVNYGLTPAYGFSAQTDGMATDHSVKLSSTLLRPGLKFQLGAVSTDTYGRSVTATTTFTTSAYQVTLKVVNEQDKPVAGAEVTLAGKAATTGADGEAKFSDIPYGSQNVVIKSGRHTTSQSIGVGLGDDGTKLDQLIVVKAQTTTDWMLLAIGGLGLTLLLGLGALGWLYRSSITNAVRRLRQRSSRPAAITAGATSTNVMVHPDPPDSPPATPFATTVQPKISGKPAKTIEVKVDGAPQSVAAVTDGLHLHETPAAPKPGSTFHPEDK